jgi:hypothetical protein
VSCTSGNRALVDSKKSLQGTRKENKKIENNKKEKQIRKKEQNKREQKGKKESKKRKKLIRNNKISFYFSQPTTFP